MRLPLILTALSLLVGTLSAHADTETFNFIVEDAFPVGYGSYDGTGSFSLNLTPGQTVYTPTTGLSLVTGLFDSIPLINDPTESGQQVTIVDGVVTDMDIFFGTYPGGTTVGPDGFNFAGLVITGTTFLAMGELPVPGVIGLYDNYWLEDGSVEFVTATPEPSSLLLLGTALVGATGMIRRRLSR